ncbi:MAG: hypothetical protein ACRD2O_01810, partial [Terriglobia bacterium]
VAAITAIALEPRFPDLRIPGDILLFLVVCFALASAAQYFWRFWRRLDTRSHLPAPRVVVIPGAESHAEEAKDVAAH